MPRVLSFLLILLALPASAVIVPGPEIEVTTPILEPPPFGQADARIATDGREFLAVMSAGGSPSSSIHAVRIASDGAPIDASPIVIASSPRHDREPDVAFDGRRYLVVWEEETAGIFGRFVERDGSMTETFRVSEDHPFSDPHDRPRLAFNGQVFLVVWNHEGGGVPIRRAALVDTSGAVVKHLDFGGLEWWGEHAVAAVGSRFYVAVPGVGVFRIGDDGSVGERVIVATDGDAADLHLVSRGEEALLAWTSITDAGNFIRSARITEVGSGEVESISVGSSRLETVFADGTGFVFVYGDAQSRVVASATAAETILLVEQANNIHVQRFGEEAMQPLQLAPRHQSGPHVAAVGAIRLAAWVERRRFVAARIGLDPTAIDLGAEASFLGHPLRVAGGPDQWLVAWHNYDRIEGIRVALDGTLLDATPFVIAGQVHYADPIDVAWNGSHYVVVFTRGIPTRLGGLWVVTAARVTAEGEVEPPEIALSTNGPNFRPAIAHGSEGSLVVWVNRNDRAIEGALLHPSGAVVPLGRFPQRAEAHITTAVAWNGRSFLVASYQFDDRIRWYSVSANGTVTAAPEGAELPGIVPFGQQFELQPHGDGFLLAYANEAEGGISAAVINRHGRVEHGPQIVAASTPFDARFGLSGRMIVYARGVDPARPMLTRVFAKELIIEPNPPRRRAVR